ncbi:MAG: hypothetical protein ACRETC_07220, partial [Gammaproteobacteria bacterium]
MNRRQSFRPFVKLCSVMLAAVAFAAVSALPTAAAAQTAAAAATAHASAPAQSTAVQAATSLPDPNLLSYADGTIVRSYTPGLSRVEEIFTGYGGMNAGTKGPIQVVYELPGVATLSSLAIALPATDTGTPSQTATIAVSTTSAKEGFRDLGSVHSTKNTGPQAIPGVSGMRVRWLRVTATVTPQMDSVPIEGIVAHGTLAPRPVNAPPLASTYWAFGNDLYAGGGVRSKPSGDPGDYNYLVVVPLGDDINGMVCFGSDRSSGYDAYPGRFAGRVWTS